MNELDEILLDQLHVARHIAKKMRKARKVMGPDPYLLSCQEANEKRIQFLETMIDDKTLLQKKHKRKKQENPDILARSTSYEWYRNFMMASNIGYKMMVDSFQAYMSYFYNKKGKQE
jgi:hypothetical protein